MKTTKIRDIIFASNVNFKVDMKSNSCTLFMEVQMRMTQFANLTQRGLVEKEYKTQVRKQKAQIESKLSSLDAHDDDPAIRSLVKRASDVFAQFAAAQSTSRASFEDDEKLFEKWKRRPKKPDIEKAGELFSPKIVFDDLSTTQKRKEAAQKLLKERSCAKKKVEAYNKRLENFTKELAAVRQGFFDERSKQLANFVPPPKVYTIADLEKHHGDAYEERLKTGVIQDLQKSLPKSFSILKEVLREIAKGNLGEELKEALEEQSHEIFSEQGIYKLILLYALSKKFGKEGGDVKKTKELVHQIAAELKIDELNSYWISILLETSLKKHLYTPEKFLTHFLLHTDQEDSVYSHLLLSDIHQVIAGISFYDASLKLCDCHIPTGTDPELIHETNQCQTSKSEAEKRSHVFTIVCERIVSKLVAEQEECKSVDELLKCYQELLTKPMNKENESKLTDVLVKLLIFYEDDDSTMPSVAHVDPGLGFRFFNSFIYTNNYALAIRYLQYIGDFNHETSCIRVLLDCPEFIRDYPNEAIAFLSIMTNEEKEDFVHKFDEAGVLDHPLKAESYIKLKDYCVIAENKEMFTLTLKSLYKIHLQSDPNLTLQKFITDACVNEMKLKRLDVTYFFLESFKDELDIHAIGDELMKEFDFSLISMYRFEELFLYLVGLGCVEKAFKDEDYFILFFKMKSKFSKAKAQRIAKAVIERGIAQKARARSLADGLFDLSSGDSLKVTGLRVIETVCRSEALNKNQAIAKALLKYFCLHSLHPLGVPPILRIVRMIHEGERQQELNAILEIFSEQNREGDILIIEKCKDLLAVGSNRRLVAKRHLHL